jgi:hypothetical protein
MKVTNEQLLAEMKSLSKIVEGNSTDIVELYSNKHRNRWS